MTPRQGLTGRNVDVRKGNDATSIDRNLGYALEFNGTDEYLQIALPSDIAVFDLSALAHGSTSLPANWTSYQATHYISTSESGSSKCIYWTAAGTAQLYRSGLTIGKKYKLAVRYKSSASVRLGKTVGNDNSYGNLITTSEWNTTTLIFTAQTTTFTIGIAAAGTIYIESITIKEDQGFDLNKDQEQILHSKNWDFERTLGTEIASGTVTIGSKYVVTAGTVEGNAVGTEFLATTNATTLDASNKVREIPNLATATFINKSGAAYNTFTGASATGFTAVEDTTLGRAVAYQTFGFQSGKRYRFSYTITVNAFSFGIGLYIGDANVGTQQIVNHAATGTSTVTYDVTANAAHGYYGFRVEAGQTADFVVSGFHFYEIPEWTAAGNHTQNLSILDKSGATGQSMLISASGACRGAELITNGTFDSNTTGWSGDNNGVLAWESSRVKLSNGTAVTGRLIQNITVESGKTYEIKFNFDKGNSVYGDLIINGSTVLVFYDTRDYRTTWTANATGAVQVRFRTGDGVAGNYVYYDSISIKEVLGEVTLPSANIESVVSGKKYTIQGEARLDASSLTYGSEKITVADDRTFDSDTGYWLKSSGVSITGGKVVVVSGTAGDLSIYNNDIITTGKIYKVVWTLLSCTSGNATAYLKGGWGTARNTAGTYTEYIIAGSAAYAGIHNGGTATYEIGDISIVEATLAPTLTAQLGTKSVTSSALSIVAGTFTKFVLNFEATASEQSQDLKLYLSGAGSVFVDKLSLTQAYDYYVTTDAKVTRTGGNGILGTDAATPMQLGFLTTTTNFRAEVGLSNTNYVDSATSTPIADSVWHTLKYTLNRTGNASAQADSSASFNISMSLIGKHIFTQGFQIGRVWVAYLQGQVAYVQVIRFENIAQSTFNSALTGLQYPTGGGSEEVLRLTFSDGTSIVNALKDYSAKNHTVTGVNVDITNRKRKV